MSVKKQNVTITTWQFMRAWTIRHAFIVVIETSAFWLSYKLWDCNCTKLHIFAQNYKVIALLLTNHNQVIFFMYMINNIKELHFAPQRKLLLAWWLLSSRVKSNCFITFLIYFSTYSISIDVDSNRISNERRNREVNVHYATIHRNWNRIMF